MQAASHSPNPLDTSLTWHLLSVLTSIHVLPGAADAAAAEADAPPSSDGARTSELLLHTHLNMIAQLLLLGGMCEWAVYVALQLPDTPAAPNLRSATVAELLAGSVPEWLGDAAKEVSAKAVGCR